MRESEWSDFLDVFKRLSVTYERYKKTPDEVTAKADAYFHALKRLELTEVSAKADAWLERQTKMPTPAEWAGQIVRGVAADIPHMTPVEAQEWLRAEKQKWDGDCCGCAECQAHGVAELPRRFVPILDADDRDVRARIGDRIVTRGEWIHSAALMRWHLARERFYTEARARGHGRTADLIAAGASPRGRA